VIGRPPESPARPLRYIRSGGPKIGVAHWRSFPWSKKGILETVRPQLGRLRPGAGDVERRGL